MGSCLSAEDDETNNEQEETEIEENGRLFEAIPKGCLWVMIPLFFGLDIGQGASNKIIWHGPLLFAVHSTAWQLWLAACRQLQPELEASPADNEQEHGWAAKRLAAGLATFKVLPGPGPLPLHGVKPLLTMYRPTKVRLGELRMRTLRAADGRPLKNHDVIVVHIRRD